MRGPLEGVRVLDFTDDSGRLAAKLLAECGASVVRLSPSGPAPGWATASGPPMADPRAAARGGLLDWWYGGGQRRLVVDLDQEAGRSAYRTLAGAADLIVETLPAARLGDLGLDHPDLVEQNPGLVQVSLTPFGRTGPRAGWRTSDLVAAAMGGVLSLSGLPDQPINPWGRQAYNVAGFMAAICGLAGLRDARCQGRGQHIDISVQEAVCTTVEQLLFQYWFDDVLPYPKIAPRQGSLHWIRAYRVVPAAEGWIMTTSTPNFRGMLAWLGEEQVPGAEELTSASLAELVGKLDLVTEAMAALAAKRDATSLFHEAQNRHIAWGEVQTVAQVAENPQHAHRGFFRPVDWDGPQVRVPGPLARFGTNPVSAPLPPAAEASDVEEVLASWDRSDRPPAGGAAGAGSAAKPLEGLRVLDLSHVLAGPMCTRVLGDLGADIIKVQTQERALSVNDPGHPYFYVYNRSKRTVALNMKDPRAVDIIRRLVELSDVLIENFSAGVLERWGLGYEQVSQWRPELVYVTMSGCGHDGPWSSLVTYAPTIHALAGITYLSNPPGRGDLGPGFSLNDHAAGLSAAVAVLCALRAREETGRGQHVDISQMETGGYLIGPALVDYLSNGREAQPVGNRDPFGAVVPNDCYPTADGRWLAVSCRDDAEWSALVGATDIPAPGELAVLAGRTDRVDEVDKLVADWALGVEADAGAELLQAAGVPAGPIQHAGDLMEDPQLVARGLWGTFDHDGFGTRPRDRFPARWSRSDLEPYRPAVSYVGQDNFEVYGQLLGLEESEVAEGMGDGLFT